MRLRLRYALLGVLLGLGAPLGSLAWQVITHSARPVAATLLSEWQTASYYYLYMTIGTVAAFGLFGLVLGRHDEDLNDLSITDGLTGIFNHRYLQEQLTREVQRSDRYASPLTCLMLDIDDFKKVNDQHGHPFGDEVLRTVALLTREAVRQTDVVGRYGGEEFLVIMPQTSSEDAMPLADRILKAVQCRRFPANGTAVRVTISIGLATYPRPEYGVKTKNALLSAADQALYRAKRAGKNQTVAWTA